jgi:hypothetical protein
MEDLTHYPLLLFTATFIGLWLAAGVGSWLRRRNPSAGDEQTEDLGVVLGATLTLLALIIGFSVSMASSRYDQRKSFEEAEANAIGTEILRADLLPPADGVNVRRLLDAYLDQRILFFIDRDETRQMQIDQSTSQLQANLWAAVRGSASAQPTPVAALVLAGMNDVINSQGYTQAAFWKWFDPSQSPEPGKFSEVAWALKFTSGLPGYMSVLRSSVHDYGSSLSYRVSKSD